MAQQLAVFVGNWLRHVEDYQYQVSVGERFHGFADANALRFIERPPDSRSIHQLHGNSADRNRFADQIARRPRLRSDNRALPLYETIKQARLTDVGAPDNGERQSFVHKLSIRKAREKFLERTTNGSDLLEDRGVGSDGNVSL